MHSINCDCFECVRVDEMLAKGKLKPYLVDATGHTDFADVLAKPATYFYDATLVATKPVTLVKEPTETAAVLQEFPKGSNVGKIDFHVVRNGDVWWGVRWFSGKFAGYVKHQKGLFNADIIEQTATQPAFDKQMENQKKYQDEQPAVIQAVSDVTTGAAKLVSGAGDALGAIGGNFKLILILALVGVLVYGFMTYKKVSV